MNRIEAWCFALLVTPLVGLNFAFFPPCTCKPYGVSFSMTISCVPSLDGREWNCVPLSKKKCVSSYLLEVIRVWVEEITAITTVPALVNTVKQRKQFTPN
jgi:hypothetical protein